MPVKTSIESLSVEIAQLAEAHELQPSEMTRRKFIELGGSNGRTTQHHWGAAKALACGDAVPVAAVPEGHVIKGVSTLIDRAGRTTAQWVKTRKETEDPEAVFARIAENFQKNIIPCEPMKRYLPLNKSAEDRLAIYPLGDMHLGMYAAAREAGEDWDTDKAVNTAKEALNDLTIDGAPAREGLLINVGDYFHADGPSNRTPKSGHSLDVDGRYFEILEKGLALKVYMVQRLLQVHETVRVWTRVGNHDMQTSLGLAIALKAFFANNPRVTVEINPGAADYLRFGRNLIGCTHGDTYTWSKPEALIAIMAEDRKQDWGVTDYRYWYVGHVHHRSYKEVTGGCVETFRTLAPKDYYHAVHGYRAKRDMNRIVLHKKGGEESRTTYGVRD